MSRILVTGHTGFIGRFVAAELSRRGHEVVGVSRSAGFDLERNGALAEISRPDVIIHLAGRAGVVEGWRDPASIHQGNLLPALCVLDQARLWRVPVVVVSSYMYGAPAYNPVDEAHPLACNNPYAHAKRLVEMMAEAYHRDFGVAVTLIRPFNLYGPGQGNQSLIGLILEQVTGESPDIRLNDLRPSRDWLHMADFARAMALVAERPPAGFEIFNLGSGKSHTVAEVVDLAQNAAGTTKPVVDLMAHRPNEIMDCRADWHRFAAAYDWAPSLTLDAGLKAILESR